VTETVVTNTVPETLHNRVFPFAYSVKIVVYATFFLKCVA
jgi:hypothetical protein